MIVPYAILQSFFRVQKEVHLALSILYILQDVYKLGLKVGRLGNNQTKQIVRQK
jgi:hypothetical protein